MFSDALILAQRELLMTNVEGGLRDGRRGCRRIASGPEGEVSHTLLVTAKAEQEGGRERVKPNESVGMSSYHQCAA